MIWFDLPYFRDSLGSVPAHRNWWSQHILVEGLQGPGARATVVNRRVGRAISWNSYSRGCSRE